MCLSTFPSCFAMSANDEMRPDARSSIQTRALATARRMASRASTFSRLRKKVLRRCRYATLIQIRSRWRTKDSIERRFGFECCASSTFL